MSPVTNPLKSKFVSPQKKTTRDPGFFAEFFGFSREKVKGELPQVKRNGFLTKFKNSFAYYSPGKSSKKTKEKMVELSISGPTNFAHVTGTAQLNLISLEEAKKREKKFLDQK